MQATLKLIARNEKSKCKKLPSESDQEASKDNGGRNKTIQPGDLAVLGDREHSKPEDRRQEPSLTLSEEGTMCFLKTNNRFYIGQRPQPPKKPSTFSFIKQAVDI